MTSLAWPHPIGAVVFDLDGVLIDSEPLHFEATRLVLERYGVPYTEDDHREFLGCTFYDMYAALRDRHGLTVDVTEVVRRRSEALVPLYHERGVPMDGVLEVLEWLRDAGRPLAVASSSLPELIRIKLEVLGVASFFAATVSGWDVARGKPAPDVFLEAARRLGQAPEHCLAVEDSRNGMLAARAAGMACAVVPCAASLHQDFSEATVRLRRLPDLIAVLEAHTR